MPSTVEVMAEAFHEAGTPFIVGHPGGESVELMEAARNRGMRFILVKQESAGAMLAATWGDITGSPGVCMSTRAPGAANMVNGVTHAWMDRSPLIAITDQYGPATYATGLRQRLDQLKLYDSVTKWNATIGARTVRHTLRRAMRVVSAPPPGPVQLDLPSNETLQEAADLPADVPLLPQPAALRPDRDSLKPALEMLARARRPIILAGIGVLWDRASDGVVALAEQLGAPVLTTTKAKGLIPEDHPLRAGAMIGGLIEREIISQADLIVTIGLDGVELQPKPWPYTAPVLAVSNTQSTDALVPASPELVGSLGPILSSLAEFASAGSGWGEGAAREYQQQLSDALEVPSTGLAPARLVEIARDVLPRDTIASCDAGRQSTAGGPEVADVRPARVPDLERAGDDGVRDPGRHGGPAGAPGPPGRLLHRRRRLLDGHRRAAHGRPREPADRRGGVRRSGDRPDPGEAGDQGDGAVRHRPGRDRLGEDRAGRRRGRHHRGDRGRARGCPAARRSRTAARP